MMPNLKEIAAGVLEHSSLELTPEGVLMFERIATDLVSLHARAALGEDVAAELATTHASALSIAAAKAELVNRSLHEVVRRYVGALLGLILPKIA